MRIPENYDKFDNNTYNCAIDKLKKMGYKIYVKIEEPDYYKWFEDYLQLQFWQMNIFLYYQMNMMIFLDILNQNQLKNKNQKNVSIYVKLNFTWVHYIAVIIISLDYNTVILESYYMIRKIQKSIEEETTIKI